MSTITKEQAQSVSDLKAGYTLGHADVEILNDLARIALASLEAEAVGSIARHKETGKFGSYLHPKADWFKNDDYEVLSAYTAPPAPVSVPAAMEIDDDFDSAFEHGKAVGWNAYRAAMLQAEPVTTAYKLPDDFDFDRFNDVVWLETVASNPHMHSPTTSTIAMVALELNRKLAAGNSPVIPDGWVDCSERMPKKGERDIWLFDGEFVHHGYIWDGHDFVDWNEEYESIKGITHWMKMALPAAPQPEA